MSAGLSKTIRDPATDLSEDGIGNSDLALFSLLGMHERERERERERESA